MAVAEIVDVAGSWGGRVDVWTLASSHAVGGFIVMVLHWMSRLVILCIIKVCFRICSAPDTHQTSSVTL